MGILLDARYWYRDVDGDLHRVCLVKEYPSARLLRFSDQARAQLLNDGKKDFDIMTQYVGKDSGTMANLQAIITYLTEMLQQPSSPAMAPRPVMSSHFGSLRQAMHCLALVKFFDLDPTYDQVYWIRAWIETWLKYHDLLPDEVLCAWRLFKDNTSEHELLDKVIQRAATTWNKNTLYFEKGQEDWAFMTRIKPGEQELWDMVKATVDSRHGKSAFENMWRHATVRKNLRDSNWHNDDRYADWARETKHFRERLKGSRAVHMAILGEALGWNQR